MMREGFIYNKDKCVNCKACSAACIMQNGWNISAREIFSYNAEADPLIPLINLSLACNHCESAVCMTGCPSSAYRRDENTGAIILDENKCIGCRYCQWNCPYDAPKFDHSCNTIVKCSLCYSEHQTGIQPACVVACPTGALKFGILQESLAGEVFSWFPDKKLNPAVEFTSDQKNISLRIIPENNYADKSGAVEIERKNISDESSLLIFTFLSTLLVSAIASSFIKGVYPNIAIYLSVLILTGIISLFHLGKKNRFWRAIANVRKSALSREIAAFIIFSLVSTAALILQRPVFLFSALIAGLIYLLLIDSVYIFPDKRRQVFFHSGQTFISALIIISFLSGEILPFIFMALIKIVLFYKGYTEKPAEQHFMLRFLRIAFLIIPGLSLANHYSKPDYFVISIFLTGELFDRILFYIDFDPVNIRKLMSEQLNIEKNEKKRG
jgi:Fe-S-cluster-containing dehydrogenase component